MPRIRQFNNTQTINPQPLEQAAYRVERTGMLAGEAVRQGFDQAARATGEVENAVAQSETSDLSNKIAQLDLDTTQKYEDAKQNGDPNDPQFASKFVANNIDPALEKLGEGLTTPQAQRMFQEASLQMRKEYIKRGIADQASFAGAASITNFKQTVTSLANSATNDPTSTDHAANLLETLSQHLPAEHRQTLVNAGQDVIYGSGAKSYLDAAIKNPNATDATLDAAWAHVSDPKNGFVDHVNPDTYAALQKQYEGAKETLGAARSQMADQNWTDLMARIKTNGGNDVEGSAQALINSYQGRNAAETQVWRAQHQKALDETVAYGQATAGVPTMAESDVVKTLNDLQDQIAKAAPGDLGKLQAKQSAIMSAMKQRDQEFRADQASYVLNNSSVVQARYQAYAQNPNAQTFAQYAQTSAAEQKRLYPDVMPRLVTRDMEQSVSSELAAITQTPDGAARIGDLLDRWSSVAGGYWGQISSELTHDRVLNPAQSVAASMWSNPANRGAAQIILRASVTPDKELQTLGGADVTAVKAQKAAADALSDFRVAMSVQANGADLYSNYANTLAKTLQYVGSTDNAADFAKKMVLDEYQFSGRLMMPASVDKSSVVAGTRSVQNDIGNHHLVIPPSLSGTGPADQRAEYVRDIQQSGYWIMSGDNKSAMLMTERGEPVYETIKGQTRPVSLDWATLSKLGQ